MSRHISGAKATPAGERGFADPAQDADVDQMVLAQADCPPPESVAQLLQYDKSLIQLDSVPPSVVEGYCFDSRESL